MNIAYIRVSSIDQNTDRQHEILKSCNIEKVFEEKLSGKTTDRPELKSMLSYAREGDTIYIESISRLARNTRDFLTIVDELTAKNVKLVSMKENIDTTSETGKFMLTVFAALSEMERQTLLLRQKEGLDEAKKRGVKFGRPKIQINDKFKAAYKKWRNGEMTAVEAMKKAEMTKNTFYIRVREYEESQEK